MMPLPQRPSPNPSERDFQTSKPSNVTSEGLNLTKHHRSTNPDTSGLNINHVYTVSKFTMVKRRSERFKKGGVHGLEIPTKAITSSATCLKHAERDNNQLCTLPDVDPYR